MLVTLLILLLFYSISFLWRIDDSFLQTKYDWNNVQSVKTIGKVDLDSVSYNFVRLKINSDYQTDCNHSFILKDINKKSYYFRAAYTAKDKDKISFYGLEWLIQKPPKKPQTYLFSEVVIPFTQKGVKSVVTIGDAHLSDNEAKYFRINMAGKAPVFFKGQKHDVFNYPHWADRTFNTDSIINIAKKVAPADYYILFFDGNNQAPDVTKLKQIKTELLKKNPKKIFWISLPDADENYQAFNKALTQISDGETLIINLKQLIGNKKSIYLSDGKSLNKTSYIKISNAIAKYIDD